MSSDFGFALFFFSVWLVDTVLVSVRVFGSFGLGWLVCLFVCLLSWQILQKDFLFSSRWFLVKMQ